MFQGKRKERQIIDSGKRGGEREKKADLGKKRGKRKEERLRWRSTG
jgi:hypothetical protein